MPQTIWSQEIFTRGELSPLMYTRVSVNAYYNALKTATNVLSYPQGAAGKRFGTEYLNEVTGVTDEREIFFCTFQYYDQCVYQIVIKPSAIDIYLEGTLQASVNASAISASGGPLTAEDIETIDHTILENRLIFCVDRGSSSDPIRPQQVTRGNSTAIATSTVNTSTNVVTHTGTLTAGGVYPVRFTFTGTRPTTSPQIINGRVYFVKSLTNTTYKVYTNAVDAANDDNEVDFSTVGVTWSATPLTNWTISNYTFNFVPVYDFADFSYSSITFTLSATSGPLVTLTSSANIFSLSYINGVFEAQGGIARIGGYVSPTEVTVSIEEEFPSTSISGKFVYLAEPAWSNTRGWPRKCSSYQNRSILANTYNLPNGLWLSSINDYNNFDDSNPEDADNAISWYPSSNEVNFIKFIVPYRSLTIHTNSAIFSTPLAIESAITPQTFSLLLQDSTPADTIEPVTIDNQIVIVSGNDVHSMLWDGFNAAYNSNILSITNEQLIRAPKDSASYVDLNRAGSRYVFFVNSDGTLAMMQTLIAEEVMGFTPASLKQPYGNAYFRKVASNFDGRLWFITEREIAEADTSVVLTSWAATFLIAAGLTLSETEPTAVKFTTTGTLPTSTPQIVVDRYYWAVGIAANEFYVYTSYEDAIAGINPISFFDLGTGTNEVEPWPLSTKFYLEELDFDLKVDCATKYSGSATTTISDLDRLNAQSVLAQGDGSGYDNIVIDNDFTFSAHNEGQEVTEAQVGFGIEVVMEPLPLAIPVGGSSKQTNLVFPKHIRNASFVFENTIGGEVNGKPIALKTFGNIGIGEAPSPSRGVFEYGLMKGWNDYRYTNITITHEAPFDIRLLGIFYKVEV